MTRAVAVSLCMLALCGPVASWEFARITFTLTPDDPDVRSAELILVLNDLATDGYDAAHDAIAYTVPVNPLVRMISGVDDTALQRDARPAESPVGITAYWTPASSDLSGGIRDEVWGLGAVAWPAYDDLLFIEGNNLGVSGTTTGIVTWEAESNVVEQVFLYDVPADTEMECLPGGTHAWEVQNRHGIGPDFVVSCTLVDALPQPPQNVSASDATYHDRVVVRWDEVQYTYAYSVYRNTVDDPFTAELLADWLRENQYHDLSTEPGVDYWYWVVARNHMGESNFSASDTGSVSTQREIYVDCNAPGPEHNGTTWPTALLTIQEAVAAARNGKEIIVAPGEYPERITFEGSNITSDFVLRSVDPGDPLLVAGTIINGDVDGDPSTREGSTLTLSGNEDTTFELCGVMITGGRAGKAGGVRGSGTHATISSCIIARNYARSDGGGLHDCDGAIIGNTIDDNGGVGLFDCDGQIVGNLVRGNRSFRTGGGLYGCDGLIAYNTITQNWGDEGGGGLYGCHGTITGNIISDNGTVFWRGGGGGLYDCDGLISSNIVTNNHADDAWGGGLANCDGAIVNCTVVGNSAHCAGGLECSAAVTNSVIWANRAEWDPQLPSDSAAAYCCIQDWTGGGEGNTSENPQFVADGYWVQFWGLWYDWTDGDYRLLPTSPCIDSANGDEAPGLDITGRPRWDHPEAANTGVGTPDYADMGAYESYLQTFTSPPGFLRNGWNLVSTPVEPARAAVESVWDGCLAAGNVLAGNLYGFTEAKTYAAFPHALTETHHARGYWLRLTRRAVEDVVGEPIGPPAHVPLSTGWNVIGHPCVDDALWANCLIDDGDAQLSVEDAAAAGWIQGVLFYFDPVSSRYNTVPGYDDSLHPWYGYWVLANVAGLTLIVP